MASTQNLENISKKSPIYNMCSQMSGFCYDSAKEIADRERDAAKSSKLPLAGLMQAFSQLCWIEKQYYSLTFLTPKRFLMKDTNLTGYYTGVINDMKKVEEWRSSTTTREIAAQMVSFIEARLELMKLYEQIANEGASIAQNEATADPNVFPAIYLDQCLMPVDDVFVPKISTIVRKYYNCLSNELLQPLRDLFIWELDALQGLFSCYHHLSHWRYMEAMFNIDKAKTGLQTWVHALQTHTESRSSGFSSWFSRTGSPAPSLSSSMASSPALTAVVAPEATEDTTETSITDPDQTDGGSPTGINHYYVEPALYSWFYKLRQAILSKLTVFFYNVLKEYHNEESMKEFCSRLHNDIPGKLLSGQERHEISYIMLVFDATKEVGYKGPGAHHPEIKKDPPRGLALYPLAFSYPWENPEELKPSLISAISEWNLDLKTCNKIVYSYDQRLNITYFMMRIEAKMTLCFVYQGKRPDKDVNLNNLMIDIATQLRMSKTFASIRPGYKS